MIDIPRENGNRDRAGRFKPGNQAAVGNPHARHVGRLRTALLKATRPGDVKAIVRKLIDQAKAGNTTAARVLLDRVFGPAQPVDMLERLESLEKLLESER